MTQFPKLEMLHQIILHSFRFRIVWCKVRYVVLDKITDVCRLRMLTILRLRSSLVWKYYLTYFQRCHFSVVTTHELKSAIHNKATRVSPSSDFPVLPQFSSYKICCFQISCKHTSNTLQQCSMIFIYVMC